MKCLAVNGTTIRTGKDNCWAYWLEGQAVDGIDQFVWVTNETATCNDGASSGADCYISKEIPCNASKLNRLNLNANQVCIPTF